MPSIRMARHLRGDNMANQILPNDHDYDENERLQAANDSSVTHIKDWIVLASNDVMSWHAAIDLSEDQAQDRACQMQLEEDITNSMRPNRNKSYDINFIPRNIKDIK
jgi:uncharacterized Zn finger protein